MSGLYRGSVVNLERLTESCGARTSQPGALIASRMPAPPGARPRLHPEAGALCGLEISPRTTARWMPSVTELPYQVNKACDRAHRELVATSGIGRHMPYPG